MNEQGKNEKTRLVELSDPSAQNLDDAFHNMWVVAANTKCTKPLHHISINPMKDERLTDAQLMKIVEHCEKIYGYPMFHHQRVIVEHIKDGRQHFHVVWNRVSLVTGRSVWPKKHWNKSKQICREMEKALGLKSPTPHMGGKRPKVRLFTKTRRVQSYAIKQRSTPAWAAQPILLHRPRIILFSPSPSAPQPVIFQPDRPQRGWPAAAVLDWKVWGHRNPRRFFTLWYELSQ